MSDAALRKQIIRLAHANPEMRPHLLPLLREAGTKVAAGSGAANATYLKQSPLKDKILRAVAKHYGVSVSAIEDELTDPDAEALYEYIGNDAALQMQVYRDFKSKGLTASTSRKAHGPVAIQGPQVMLYAIDSEKNQSKFYEMTVVPFGTSADRARPTVKKDKDFRRMGMGGYTLSKRWGRLTDTGGISGRFDGMDEFYDTEAAALGAMRATKADKMRGSGSAAYKDVSDTREYPIGLGAAGFGWGGQAACAYIPELAELHTAIEAHLKNVTRLKAYVVAIARRDSSMGKKLDGMLEPLISQMETIDAYLEMQLSECR